jgi:hypothetical protein
MTQRVIRRGRVFPEIQWTEEQKTQEKARRQAFYERSWTVFERLKPTLLDIMVGILPLSLIVATISSVKIKQ